MKTIVSDSLLPRVAAGDERAVAECLDRYANLVWSLARRFTSDRTEAEDAVQEIFIELWSSASRYDGSKASETTFIAMVARRRLIDRLRKTKREPHMEELDVVMDRGTPGPVEATEAKDDAARASRLIKTLKPEQQKIIQLAVYQGHTHQSIADSLGMPLGTVKTHLRRGLMRVRTAMQEALP
jgi:RNA polymerase sigma-70 factor (ECF subfamily)